MKARIWLAPDDGLHGRVWVWHVRGLPPYRNSTRRHYGWAHHWEHALADCLAHMKEYAP